MLQYALKHEKFVQSMLAVHECVFSFFFLYYRHECVWVKKPMPLSSYMGLVESFSSYQALLRDDPQRATGLSHDICHR